MPDRESDAAANDAALERPWMADFLRELEERGTVTAAAKAAGVSRRTVYDWRARVPEFAASIEDAIEVKLGEIEQTLLEKAAGGDLTACIFLMKAHPARRWSDRPGEDAQGAGRELAAMKRVLSELPVEQRAPLFESFQRHLHGAQGEKGSS